MATFNEANQVRIQLKMKLSQHSWYNSSAVVAEDDGYSIIIYAEQINNNVRKIVSPVIDGVSIKVEAYKPHK
jgi:hypothetical protein